MTIEESLKACEEAVRRADPDRYFSALFVPAERRPLIFALYAFNHELARVAESVREPMMGEIRLEWWREAVMEAREGRPRPHDVARGLAELFARSGAPTAPFETMIEARRSDVSPDIFPDMASLLAYVEATSGSLMRVAAQIILDGNGAGDAAHDAGVAYGLTGILRTLPHQNARRKLFLPTDVLAQRGISADDVLSGKADRQGLREAMASVAEAARLHHASARARSIPKEALPALLPAALVPVYLKKLAKPDLDPLRDLIEVPAWRKQLAYLRAAVVGRI